MISDSPGEIPIPKLAKSTHVRSSLRCDCTSCMGRSIGGHTEAVKSLRKWTLFNTAKTSNGTTVLGFFPNAVIYTDGLEAYLDRLDS